MNDRKAKGPRSIALVGPYSGGKSSLLESILFVTGVIGRKGRPGEGAMVADSAPDARERQMSTELSVATAPYLDDSFTFLDCPGSIEFLQETMNALIGADAAVVVCEPDASKALVLSPILHYLGEKGIPHLIFVNKIDKASGPVRDLLPALQEVSAKPLVLRQIPIREGDAVTGYVDLASERAYVYRDNAASERIDLPASIAEREASARYEMLEKLADFDEQLMETLLEEKTPAPERIFADLADDLRQCLIVPVLLGSAITDHGVRRLLKALRHEVPAAAAAASRLGVPETGAGESIAQVLKTYHTAQSGKLSLARVWAGTVKDGAILNGERVGGLFRMKGAEAQKIAEAQAGEVVAFGRLEKTETGATLSSARDGVPPLPRAERLKPVFSLAVTSKNRNDEVKLSGALAKICEEDPSLHFEQNQATREFLLSGQGDIHLKVAFARLRHKFGLELEGHRPKIAYREAIRHGTKQHGRFKRQSGGHGQFGDVHLEIRPLPRGEGFRFENRIVGGVVPRQFIPAVEDGVVEYLQEGPLGFPVVDVSVALYDGSYHTVDSSELAFKTAARLAMSEGMPKCDPVLLEPIGRIEVMAPSEHTSKVNSLLTGRRGQILGFDAREGWPGWDCVSAYLPETELADLIVELRSLTQGVGTFVFTFDHLQELSGRLADEIVAKFGRGAHHERKVSNL